MKVVSNDVGTRRVQAGLNFGAIVSLKCRRATLHNSAETPTSANHQMTRFHTIDLEAKVDFARRDVQKSSYARFQQTAI
jgi:hypothetical protein